MKHLWRISFEIYLKHLSSERICPTLFKLGPQFIYLLKYFAINVTFLPNHLKSCNFSFFCEPAAKFFAYPLTSAVCPNEFFEEVFIWYIFVLFK